LGAIEAMPGGCSGKRRTRAGAEHRLCKGRARSDPEPAICASPPVSRFWEELTVRILETRAWPSEHHLTPTVPVTARTAHDLLQRRDELHQLLAGAPADYRPLIEHVTRSDIQPAERHRLLVAATGRQDQRRDWILISFATRCSLYSIIGKDYLA
jgi:hypothetical protein